MTNADIYEKVTELILDALDKGVVPWQKPWTVRAGFEADTHRNLHSKKAYRGINVFLLDTAAHINGYTSPYWLSFKQVGAKGGKVRKGEKGNLVVFWKILRKSSDEIDPRTGKPKVNVIPLLKYYYVFNTDQCDGLTVPAPPEEGSPEAFDPIEAAQAVIDNMPERPSTYHRGNRAFYAPLSDEVTLPCPEDFHSPEAYYNTAYHEYAHSTGHERRLGRKKDWTAFGTDPYAQEELVAEMTAAMLCGTVGISVTHKQSASYIASWSQKLREDRKLIVSAAGQAQKAADFILAHDPTGQVEVTADKELVNA